MSATPTKSDREPHLPNTSQTYAMSLGAIPTNEIFVDQMSDQPIKPHQTILQENGDANKESTRKIKMRCLGNEFCVSDSQPD